MKYFLLSTVAVAVLATSCSNSSASNEPTVEKKVPVISVIQKDTSLQLQYVADIEAHKNVAITARLNGLLKKIHIDEGQHVKKGQLLFKIDDSELLIELNKTNAAYNSAVAEAKVAEVEVKRVESLVQKNIVSTTELDLAKAKHNALQAKTEQSLAEKKAVEQRISYTSIYSPFDGVINRLPLKEGSLLTDGSLLTTISDIHAVYAYFNISENEYFRLSQAGELNKGEGIELILPDGTRYEHTGIMQSAESEIDEVTGSIAFRAKFANPKLLLKHGASGKLLITKAIDNVLLIPQKSVVEIQDKNFVYVMDSNNVVKMKNIEPSHRIADFYVVDAGLTGNETIVYEGIQLLRDGDTIVPEKITL